MTGKLFKPEQQESLIDKACGISVIFIAIAGAMEGMLKINNSEISSGKSMLVVLCLALAFVKTLAPLFSALPKQRGADFVAARHFPCTVGSNPRQREPL